MSKGLRWSEQWFRRGLWLVAFAFAWFLVGLGDTVLGDLPKVETRATLEQFMDAPRLAELRTQVQRSDARQREAREALDQARLQQQVAEADKRAARETFANWLATRRATAAGAQDEELIRRTAQLDELRAAERQALAEVQAQQQQELDARQARERAQREIDTMQSAAAKQLRDARRAQELRVFAYRLALTLPLLGVAGWLYRHKRQGQYWPFAWGFIFFALFAFFVELVPYLPSYGGYVRYAVGIVMTVVVGRYAILALNRYLERQRAAEARPDAERRQALSYDDALARLGKSVCPGCERPVDLKDGKLDFCPHCGLGLHRHCGHCQARHSAFARYCLSCGTPAEPQAQG